MGTKPLWHNYIKLMEFKLSYKWIGSILYTTSRLGSSLSITINDGNIIYGLYEKKMLGDSLWMIMIKN